MVSEQSAQPPCRARLGIAPLRGLGSAHGPAALEMPSVSQSGCRSGAPRSEVTWRGAGAGTQATLGCGTEPGPPDTLGPCGCTQGSRREVRRAWGQSRFPSRTDPELLPGWSPPRLFLRCPRLNLWACLLYSSFRLWPGPWLQGKLGLTIVKARLWRDKGPASQRHKQIPV